MLARSKAWCSTPIPLPLHTHTHTLTHSHQGLHTASSIIFYMLTVITDQGKKLGGGVPRYMWSCHFVGQGSGCGV